MHFLLNRWTLQLQTLQVHRSYDVEHTGQRFVSVLVNVKSEIMYFLVNASPPKLLDVETYNFAAQKWVFSLHGWCTITYV